MNRSSFFSVVLAITAPAQMAKLVTVDGRAALRIGGRTTRLSPDSLLERKLKLGDIDADRLFHQWLKDDDRWSGHAAANEIRYMDTQGGGVGAAFTDVVTMKGGVVFGVMSLKCHGPSGEPTRWQILVRKAAGSNSVEWVRQLSELPQVLYRPSPQRLYEFRGQTLLLDQGGLFVFRPDGNIGGKVADIGPLLIPRGVADRRFIVFGPEQRGDGGRIVEAYDSVKRRMFTVLETALGPSWKPQPSLDDVYIGDSPYLQFSAQIGLDGAYSTFSVRLPDLKRHREPATLWPIGEYGFEVREGKVHVYRFPTGREVQVLRLPGKTS